MSTHGYSQNQILVWKYPSLTQVAKLTGHSYRVLYLVSISPLGLHAVGLSHLRLSGPRVMTTVPPVFLLSAPILWSSHH